ncbi:MAG: helix-turn-helix domain-containing protein [Planctomycetaceae bacterium]
MPRLTVRQVAELLQVKPQTVREFIAAGWLRAINVASPSALRPRWRIHVTDLAAFENRRSAQQPAQSKRRRRQSSEITQYY